MADSAVLDAVGGRSGRNFLNFGDLHSLSYIQNCFPYLFVYAICGDSLWEETKRVSLILKMPKRIKKFEPGHGYLHPFEPRRHRGLQSERARMAIANR